MRQVFLDALQSASETLSLTALQGYQPAIQIFSTQDLQQQASLAAGASWGYTAVALSHDGELLAVCADRPDQELSVWHWRQASAAWPGSCSCQHTIQHAPAQHADIWVCASKALHASDAAFNARL